MVANKMLVVVDTQFDFVMPYGKLYVPGAERIIPSGYRVLINLNPEEYRFVLRTMDTHTESSYQGSTEQQGWPEKGIPPYPIHCVADTPGWKNVFDFNNVNVRIQHFELKKKVFDAWENPWAQMPHVVKPITLYDNTWFTLKRDEFFKQIRRDYGIETLTVFGVASDRCVKDFIAGALDFGFAVEVVEDACAGLEHSIRQVVYENFDGQVTFLQSKDFDPKKEEWVDEDDAPPLGEEFFENAVAEVNGVPVRQEKKDSE